MNSIWIESLIVYCIYKLFTGKDIFLLKGKKITMNRNTGIKELKIKNISISEHTVYLIFTY